MIPNNEIATDVHGPHQGAMVYTSEVSTSTKALILIHGRGASAANIFQLSKNLPRDIFVLAPEAFSYTWYPNPFTVPQEDNEPALGSAIEVLHASIMFLKSKGFAEKDIFLAGFSQGACLAVEYVKRYPRRYGGVAVMSGGLIGSDYDVQASVEGDLANTPIYIGCDANDPFIPLSRVQQTTAYLSGHNAAVSEHIYEGMGHAIHPDALEFLTELL